MEDSADAHEAQTSGRLPDHLRRQQESVTCGVDLNYHVTTGSSAHLFKSLGIDNSWSYKAFKRGFRVAIKSMRDDDMQFDLIGIDAAIANAFRRILISEVPTMAIERVFIVNNTSIVMCEVLSHRLGLVPIRIDPEHFDRKTGDETFTEKDCIVFKLDVRCHRAADGGLVNDRVTSAHLHWLPGGSEMPEETNCRFAASQEAQLPDGVGLVHSDILLAKMRPGQEIVLEAHCTKGAGAEHAKWSPVATAWYRLQPEVEILSPVTGDKADALAAACPGLFRVEGSGAARRAVAGDARAHDLLLEKVRRMSGEEAWAEHVALRKRKDHFIFTVESTGALPPDVLFARAVDALAAKCDKLLELL